MDVEVPKLDTNGNEISGEFVTAQELKVGKMEGAIGGSPTGLTIDDDVDRFYVKIPGLTGMTDVSVKIETIDNPGYALDYSDDPQWLELEELSDGSGYRSPSQLLVSDDVDDDEDLHDVGADDQLNDRTHKVQLGGKLKVSALKINGIEHQVSITKDVKVRKELDVTFVILRKNGVAITSGAELSGQLQQLRERFAQIGVKVNLATPGIEYADVEQMESDGVQVPYDADGDDEFEPGQTSAPSADERLLFDSYGTTDDTSDVRIFYVEELAGFNVGLAYTAEAAQELGRPEWANNIVMSKVANLRDLSPVLFVLPHEVTHLLLDDDLPDDGHLADQKNLMHGTSFTIDWIGGRKRLNREQEVMIFENDEGLLE